MVNKFDLNGSLDFDLLQRVYAARHRLHIPEFLAPESAQRLLTHLQSQTDWPMVFNSGPQIYELNTDIMSQTSVHQREQLDRAIYDAASDKFQFRYRSIRISDDVQERLLSKSLLADFANFLSSEKVLDVFQKITGRVDFNFADAQATCYIAGDFLTSHDDAVANKNRRAAYVMNLTPRWRAECGGLLMFHGSDGHIDEAYVPRFNALNIFTVPQIHSVSQVTPAAPAPRYAITGWLRELQK
jgi:SM-20-related protein